MFRVSFYNEDGSLFLEKKVKPFQTTTGEILPSTEDKIFIGWFTDGKDDRTFFHFTESVKGNMKLYPKFLEPTDRDFSEEESLFRAQYVTMFGEVPTVRITTESSPDIEKPEYAFGVFSLDCTDGAFNMDAVAMQMRLRGNFSRYLPKGSYKVKFDKKNTSVFGNSGNKNWALVANYLDRTLLRNYVTYLTAQTLDGFDFAPKTYFVDLILNGEKKGLYLLMETVEASPARVDLEEQPTAANGDTGFILEQTWGAAGAEDIDYIVVGGIQYEINYPKIDDDGIDPNRYGIIVAYMKDYVRRVNLALDAKDYGAFLDLCDEDSFVDFLLIQELSKNIDADASSRSVYFYKKPNDKLHMGPVWDFDQTYGTYEGGGPYGYFVRARHLWFKKLTAISEFCAAYRTRYIWFYKEVFPYVLNALDDAVFYIYPSVQSNFERWPELLNTNSEMFHSQLHDIHSFGEHYGFMRSFLIARADWLYRAALEF
jgi:hypothetical protein